MAGLMLNMRIITLYSPFLERACMPYHIALCNVTKTFVRRSQSVTVLKDCNMIFKRGSTYAITGASGTGKTTLLFTITGIEEPTKGDIFFDDALRVSLKEGCSFTAFVPQSPKFFKEMTAYENCSFFNVMGALDKKHLQESKHRLDLLFTMFQLEDLRDMQISQISRGQLQRIAIIRALASQVPFILIDEPTANLDAATSIQVMDVLLECQKQWNFCLIIASHDKVVTDRMQVVLVLQDGRLAPLVTKL